MFLKRSNAFVDVTTKRCEGLAKRLISPSLPPQQLSMLAQMSRLGGADDDGADAFNS